MARKGNEYVVHELEVIVEPDQHGELNSIRVTVDRYERYDGSAGYCEHDWSKVVREPYRISRATASKLDEGLRRALATLPDVPEAEPQPPRSAGNVELINPSPPVREAAGADASTVQQAMGWTGPEHNALAFDDPPEIVYEI